MGDIAMAIMGAIISTTVSAINGVSVSTSNNNKKNNEMEAAMNDIHSQFSQANHNLKNVISTLNETVIIVNSQSELLVHSINLQ